MRSPLHVALLLLFAACGGGPATSALPATPVVPQGHFGELELVLGERLWELDAHLRPEWVQFDLADRGETLVIRQGSGPAEWQFRVTLNPTSGALRATRIPAESKHLSYTASVGARGRLVLTRHPLTHHTMWEVVGDGIRRHVDERRGVATVSDFVPRAAWARDPMDTARVRGGTLLTPAAAKVMSGASLDYLFHFVGVAGIPVAVEIETPGMLGVTLYGPDGRRVMGVESDTGATLRVTPPADGMYFLAISREAAPALLVVRLRM